MGVCESVSEIALLKAKTFKAFSFHFTVFWGMGQILGKK